MSKLQWICKNLVGVGKRLGSLTIICCCTGSLAVASSGDRTFELVSPPYKGGYGASLNAVALNGERVDLFSQGVFAGAPQGFGAFFGYVAQRSASGWFTVPTIPPATILPSAKSHDVSPEIDLTMVLGKPGSNKEAALQTGIEVKFLLHATELPDLAENWEIGGLLEALDKKPLTVAYSGASSDFCHILFREEHPLLPEAIGTKGELYEVARGCGGQPASLRLVGVRNSDGPHGEPRVIDGHCNVGLGISDNIPTGRVNAFNSVADNGREIFFTAGIDNACDIHQLFVRLEGAHTIEVSRSLETCVQKNIVDEVPCDGALGRPSADFVGASSDGSKAFFMTRAQLVGGDKDVDEDLYMANIGCPVGEGVCNATSRELTSLEEVSHDPNALQSAEIQGVVRVAPNGSRIYFVAHGDLLNQSEQQILEVGGLAVPHLGADNLYVYDDAEKKIAFIADLCSEQTLSGTAEDSRCPGDAADDSALWLGFGPEAQSAGTDGRFLVFSSYAQLTVTDTDTARDVYRYDAQTGELDRVSLGEEGDDSNGNNDEFDATVASGHIGGLVDEQYEMDHRAISDDGSRIVFSTAEPLSVHAVNGLVNIYEWHKSTEPVEGKVSLVSSGSADTGIQQVAMSLAGDDLFFVTTQGLVRRDTDGADDIYDARLPHNDGEVVGVPLAPPVERQSCSGDACQGALTNLAPLLVPGSVVQAPNGNIAPERTKASKVKRKKKVVRKKIAKKNSRAKHGQNRHRSGRLTGTRQRGGDGR